MVEGSYERKIEKSEVSFGAETRIGNENATNGENGMQNDSEPTHASTAKIE